MYTAFLVGAALGGAAGYIVGAQKAASLIASLKSDVSTLIFEIRSSKTQKQDPPHPAVLHDGTGPSGSLNP